MKLVCVSDTHTDYEHLKVPDGDVLIHAGDIDLYELKDAIRFNKWLGNMPHKHKIVIGGNHDKWLAQTDKHLIMDVLRNCTYLNNSGCEIGNIKFWGSPITPWFNDWFFMADRGEEIKQYWDMIPQDTHVLITHGPAYGMRDWANDKKVHLGCEELIKTIHRIQPIWHIFGHIHYSQGIDKIEKGFDMNRMFRYPTSFANVSVLDEAYKLVNKPTVIKIEEKI